MANEVKKKTSFKEYFKTFNADIFCLQETKAQPEQIDLQFDGYELFANSAMKKGYSGTAVLTRIKPKSVSFGIGMDEHDTEGRCITLEFDKFYLVNVYTPNSKRELERLDYRMKWEDDFKKYVKSLNKPVVICGDMNVAHREIDLKNPSSNHHNAGFTDEERGKFSALLKSGFVDSFRYKNGNVPGAYSWWSFLRKARLTNAGWRIDYFLVDERIKDQIVTASIYDQVFGSDHCPVGLELEF